MVIRFWIRMIILRYRYGPNSQPSSVEDPDSTLHFDPSQFYFDVKISKHFMLKAEFVVTNASC
jgi:hypothetical protein